MMAAQPPHSVHEKSRSPSDSRWSRRFRPRLELLEDRLPLGDTVLGLSVVALAGLAGEDSLYSSFTLSGNAEPAGRALGLFAAAPALSFDSSTGELTIRADAGERSVREAITADGFVAVMLDGQHHSSNPHAQSF